MAYTKLVSIDESTCQSVADWIDTQLSLPNNDMQTWSIPVPRNIDTKCFIKKHPTVDMSGYPTQSHFDEEEWAESWVIPEVPE